MKCQVLWNIYWKFLTILWWIWQVGQLVGFLCDRCWAFQLISGSPFGSDLCLWHPANIGPRCNNVGLFCTINLGLSHSSWPNDQHGWLPNDGIATTGWESQILKREEHPTDLIPYQMIYFQRNMRRVSLIFKLSPDNQHHCICHDLPHHTSQM